MIHTIQAVIPVQNEEETLSGVVTRLKLQGVQHIRIVDNGSIDQTAEIAVSLGAEVLVEPQKGYGRACWLGIQGLKPEIEWVLFCDGDGSDPIESLPEFLALLPEADFVLGDRTATGAGRAALTPLQKRGNSLATTLIRLGWGFQYRDLGPMRLVRRSSLQAMAMQDRGYGWTLEMQVKAIEMKLKIKEVSISYGKRLGGESKISGSWSGSIRAGAVILVTLAGLWLKRWIRNG